MRFLDADDMDVDVVSARHGARWFRSLQRKTITCVAPAAAQLLASHRPRRRQVSSNFCAGQNFARRLGSTRAVQALAARSAMPLFPKLFTFHSTSEDEAIKRHVDLKTKEIAAAMSEEMERRLEALEEALSQKLSDMERRHSEQTRQLLDALAAAKATPKPVEVEVRTGPVEVEVEPVEEGMHAAALELAPVPAKPRALSIPERMALDDQKHATMIMQKVQRGKAERSKIARSQWRRAFTAAKEMAKAEKQVSPP